LGITQRHCNGSWYGKLYHNRDAYLYFNGKKENVTKVGANSATIGRIVSLGHKRAPHLATKIMASTAVTKVYFKYFADHTDIIAQNVNLGPKGILGQLLDEEVIDEKCTTDIAKLSLTDKEKRGNELVYYLLNENNVDKYEGFLKIWEKKNPDEAGDLRMNIHELLSSQGLKVPERWAKKPANVSKQPESVVAEPKASPSDVPSKKGKGFIKLVGLGPIELLP
jgi:hypothetical protein